MPEQFARDGFAATPTAHVAAEAGLLFHYFPATVDVLRALPAERLPAPRPARRQPGAHADPTGGQAGAGA